MTHATTTVLFDIDGTLIDSNYLHVEAWAHAFADTGHAIDTWRIHGFIGMDSSTMLDTVIGPDGHEPVSELHARYYDDLAPRLRAFDGARELLRELDARGLTVVLATSAPENELAHLREELQIEDAVALVTSGEDVETAKPAPDIVRVALERAGSAPETTIMVGDSRWDVESASAAGVRTVGVLTGGTSREQLERAGAIAVYDDVAALLAALDESPLTL